MLQRYETNRNVIKPDNGKKQLRSKEYEHIPLNNRHNLFFAINLRKYAL